LIKNSQPLGKKISENHGGIFLTHTVDTVRRTAKLSSMTRRLQLVGCVASTLSGRYGIAQWRHWSRCRPMTSPQLTSREER